LGTNDAEKARLKKAKSPTFRKRDTGHPENILAGGNLCHPPRFTDSVSHAAMSGQLVFEQTFYLPVRAMKNPERSPLRVLERLARRTLV